MDNWVHVDDELPDIETGQVQVHSFRGDTYLAHYSYDLEQWIAEDGPVSAFEIITHWEKELHG